MKEFINIIQDETYDEDEKLRRLRAKSTKIISSQGAPVIVAAKGGYLKIL